MRTEESVRVGCAILDTVLIASGIAWYTLFRLTRWAVT